MLVTVFVHELDVTGQPTVPPGWRWAVHVGGNPHDLNQCVNAGWCPNKAEASLEGEMVGVAVAKAFHLVLPDTPTYRVQLLDDDPIAAGFVPQF